MESPITERHVQALWYDGALRPAGLRTWNGTPVRVIDPGAWNLEAGPDFRRAVLEVGRERARVVGDVEIHLRPSDWVAHRHFEDPAYAGVVAHVTWSSGPPPGGASGLPRGCLSICIGDRILTRSDFSPYEIDLGAYPYAKLPAGPRPCEQALAGRIDFALSLIRAAGVRRLEFKARRMKSLLVRRGCREQVFYEETLAALGYKYNAFPFREVAAAMPWRDLPHDAELAFTSLKTVAGLKAGGDAQWRCANVRPSNSPERRLASAAALFARGPGLLGDLDECNLSTREGLKTAVEIIRSQPAQTGAPPIGAGRAAAIVANVLVPLALAEGRMLELPDRLPPEDVSAPVRLTAFRVLGRDHNPSLYSGNGILIQGLIQVHREFCLSAHPDCRECRFAACTAGRVASGR